MSKERLLKAVNEILKESILSDTVEAVADKCLEFSREITKSKFVVCFDCKWFSFKLGWVKNKNKKRLIYKTKWIRRKSIDTYA